MKLTYYPANITFELKKDRVNSIVIEKSALFEKFILDFRRQTEKNGENFLCILNSQKIDLFQSAVLISSPFDITYDKRELQKKLLSHVANELRLSELSDELSELLEKLTYLLEKLCLSSDFELSFSMLDDIELLKSVETFLPSPEGNFTEKVVTFADTVSKLTGKDIFVIANCDSYISDEDYIELCKYFQYAGLWLILLRNQQRNLNWNENEYIIDGDLCELH